MVDTGLRSVVTVFEEMYLIRWVRDRFAVRMGVRMKMWMGGDKVLVELDSGESIDFRLRLDFDGSFRTNISKM
jgi:hypothetical protein